MPVYYEVTLNGVPIFKGLTKAQAYAKAEKWQGERYKRGLLKHADKGDHVEVRVDKTSGKEFDKLWETYLDGKPQRIIKEEYIP